MSLLTTFRALIPAYADKGDDEILALAELFAPEISKKRLGSLYEQALAYRIAHHFAWQDLIAEGGATAGAAVGGQIVEEKEGDLSRVYGRPASSDAGGLNGLERTAYGQEYLRILRMKIFPVITRRG